MRQLAVAHALDVPTLNNHVPDLFVELADELEAHTEESMVRELKKNSVVHGLDRLRLGFDVEEVVAEYNEGRTRDFLGKASLQHYPSAPPCTGRGRTSSSPWDVSGREQQPQVSDCSR